MTTNQDEMREAFEEFIKTHKPKGKDPCFDLWQAACESQIKRDAGICKKTIYLDSNIAFSDGYASATHDCAKFILSQLKEK